MTFEEKTPRTELIKAARENCERNLTNSKVATNPLVHSSPFMQSSFQEPILSKDIFMCLKIAIAVIIFVSIVVIDRLDIKVYNIDSKKIEEAVSYNTSMDDIGELVNKISAEKIVEVFNNME